MKERRKPIGSRTKKRSTIANYIEEVCDYEARYERDEKINEPDMNVQEARFWLASEAHRLSNVECREDIVKIYGRPMSEEEGKSWAKVTTEAIRVILQAAGLSDDWHKKPRKKVIAIELKPELEEKIMPLREHEDFKGCSMSEILRRLLLRGLEKEGYLKDNKGG